MNTLELETLLNKELLCYLSFLFITASGVTLQFGRRFARTVPKQAMPCLWRVFIRSTQVYQLSKYSVCYLCRGTFWSKIKTIFPEAFKSGWPGQIPIAPVCTSKLCTKLSVPGRTYSLYPHFFGVGGLYCFRLVLPLIRQCAVFPQVLIL